MAKNLKELRKKKVKRQDLLLKKLIERKPKRFTTSFAAFLRNFWTKVGNDPANRNSRKVLKEAATEWQGLSADDRATYEREYEKDKARYQKEIAPWKVERRFLTKPAPPYALFTKDVWQREKSSGNPRSLGEMGTYVAEQWATLTEDERRGYHERFEHSQRRYEASIRDYNNDLLDEDGLKRKLDDPEQYVSLASDDEEEDEEDDFDEFGDDL